MTIAGRTGALLDLAGELTDKMAEKLDELIENVDYLEFSQDVPAGASSHHRTATQYALTTRGFGRERDFRRDRSQYSHD